MRKYLYRGFIPEPLELDCLISHDTGAGEIAKIHADRSERGNETSTIMPQASRIMIGFKANRFSRHYV